MNDPKEIAEEAWSEWNTGLYNSELGFKQLIDHAIAAALQAEREDGCRRINDAIGDRDPIIENLKAELERVTAERDRLTECLKIANANHEEFERKWYLEQQAHEATQAERDEAVEKEQGRWQEAIYQLLLKHAPDNKIDGAGCDSGDPLDFTLTEISQAINHIVDERDEAVKVLEPFAKWAKCEDSFFSKARDTKVIASNYREEEDMIGDITAGHCRAARAFVEKVKQ